MAKYKIDSQKIYSMPKNISIRQIDDAVLIIVPETANWIVLSSSVELEIFNFLRDGNTIMDSINRFGYESTQNVIVQLEARRFCEKEIKRTGDEFKHMHLYLTNKCNLRCPHCYMFSGIADKEELKTFEIVKLFRDFRDFGGSNVTLSGGEPTIRPDFDELVKEAFDLGLKVRVLTNGSLWNEQKIEALSPMLDSIQISIDGYSEESNSKVRGEGHFEKAINTIDLLLNKGVNLSIAITPPYVELKDHLKDYAEFAIDLANNYKDKNILVKFSEGLLNGRDGCPTPSDNQDYFNSIQELRRRLHGENYEIISFAQAINHDIIMDNCMFGVFAIASNGDVYMCARTADLKSVANVRTHSFYEIVKISKAAEQSTRIDLLRPCRDCDIKYICGGGCRIEEFPELVNRSSFDKIDFKMIPPRYCDKRMRDNIYSLMIKSNRYLFKQINVS